MTTQPSETDPAYDYFDGGLEADVKYGPKRKDDEFWDRGTEKWIRVFQITEFVKGNRYRRKKPARQPREWWLVADAEGNPVPCGLRNEPGNKFPRIHVREVLPQEQGKEGDVTCAAPAEQLPDHAPSTTSPLAASNPAAKSNPEVAGDYSLRKHLEKCSETNNTTIDLIVEAFAFCFPSGRVEGMPKL